MIFFEYCFLLGKGLLVTLTAWVVAGVGSMLMGTLLGIASCSYLASTWQKRVIGGYVFIARGVPLYVQILLWYFVIPSLLGISLSGVYAATFALVICSSGYVTEIVRSGINMLPVGQWQAGFVLGYSKVQILWRIVMPQTFAAIVPALLGECESLLKSTALFATIGVIELTRAGMNIISRELNPIPVYLLLALLYLIISASMQLLVRWWYLRKNYGYR